MLTPSNLCSRIIYLGGEHMSWDRTWRLKKKLLPLAEITVAANQVAHLYDGVTVTVNKEAEDCTTCFFTVPQNEAPQTYEISIYNMGKDGFVISLEADASDNHKSEDADQLAEDLALELNAEPLLL